MKRTDIEAAGPGEILHDDQVRGLKLRVFPSGKRAFYLYYTTTKRKRRAPKLGDFPDMTLTQARELARSILEEVRAGGDPAAERRQVRPTVADLCDEYLKRHAPRNKPRTQDQNGRHIRLRILPRLGKLEISEVRLQDIEDLIADLREAPIAANRTLALLRKMFNLAERWGYREPYTNPCRHVEAYRERPRRRYLQADEIPALARALDELEELHPQAVAMIRCEILTGARGVELREAKWENLRPGRIELPDSKSGEERTIYLPRSAEEAIRSLPRWSPWIFPRRDGKGPMWPPKKVWAEIREKIGAPDLRMHDLRHSFASMRLAAGEDLAFIGRLLGHKSPHTTRRYAHLIEDAARKSVEDHAEQWAKAVRQSGS